MRLLRQLAAISVWSCASLLLLVFMGACGPRIYNRDQAYRDLLSSEKIHERQDQARLQKERDAQAAEMEARAAAFESHARQARAKGSFEVAEKSDKEARKLREAGGEIPGG